MNIGSKDGTISNNSPIIQGINYGINSTGTLNFYDGMIKGKIKTVNGNVSDQETNSTIIEATEIIDGQPYLISYLRSDL